MGPKLIPRYNLNADRLAEAIHTAVTDQKIQHRADGLGEKIRAEHGVTRAVEIIGEVIQERVTA